MRPRSWYLVNINVDDVVQLSKRSTRQRREGSKVEALKIRPEDVHVGHVGRVQSVPRPHLRTGQNKGNQAKRQLLHALKVHGGAIKRRHTVTARKNHV